MFENCCYLNQLDLRGLDTRNVTNMRYMFSTCHALTTLKISSAFVVPSSHFNMFKGCNENLTVIAPLSSDKNEFKEIDGETKSQISENANKVYVFDLGTCSPEISESLAAVIADYNARTNTESSNGIDLSALFNTTSSEAIYIGLNRADHIIVVDGDNKIISGALINKTINGIGYYPANLRLTGSITLSGDDSEFNEKLLMVGDGIKETVITFTDPKALPETDIIVEKNAKLVFTGNKEYVLLHEITFKAIGLLASANSIICTNGATIEFGA